ncbi:MAG: hypothetical protein M3308_00745 [Actinomycetota bacterium]|nr:hypothetical protein [Actinomycetota bacterium]
MGLGTGRDRAAPLSVLLDALGPHVSITPDEGHALAVAAGLDPDVVEHLAAMIRRARRAGGEAR